MKNEEWTRGVEVLFFFLFLEELWEIFFLLLNKLDDKWKKTTATKTFVGKLFCQNQSKLSHAVNLELINILQQQSVNYKFTIVTVEIFLSSYWILKPVFSRRILLK